VIEPTPRPNRISHDYSRQVSNAEAETQQIRSVGVASGDENHAVQAKMSQSRNFDNVKLNDEVCTVIL